MLRPFGFAAALLAGLFFACGNGDSSSSPQDGGGSDGASGGGSGSGSGGGSGGGSGSGSGGGSGSSSGSGGGSGGGSGSSSGSGSGSGSGGASGSSSGGGVDASAPLGASVLQFHNHINRDGFFVDSALTAAKAASFALDTTFAGKVTGNVYASPLYVENGPGGKGTFYLATEAGMLFALDETTGAVTWSQNVATPANASGAGCGNIGPIGITGTPAIDLGSRLIVFDAASADNNKNIATHTIHALSIDTGKEAWKVDVSTLKDPNGVAFSPQPQNQRAAVLIVNGVAYVAYGGHWGDCGTYHGWVVGVPLSGTGAKAWATQVKKGGIWGSGGPASDGQSVYVTTGNGSDANTTWANSEGLFRLDPGPIFSGAAADYFAPYNWYNLDQGDTDLSGSGPLIIDAPEMTPSKLAMALGKDGYLYLLDRSNLGGIATQSQLAGVGALKVQSGEISNAAAWAHVGSSTYVVLRPNGNNGGVGCPNGTTGDLVGVKLDPAAQDKMSVVWCAKSNGNGSPSISTSDGNSDPLVWIYGAKGTDHLYAINLATGAVVGTSADTGANVRSFTTPIIVHGRIFVGGDGQLFAFKTK